MILKNTPLIAILMSAFYFVMSVPVLVGQPVDVWAMGLIFLLVSICGVYMVAVNHKLEEHLIPTFAFAFYFVYMTMAQLYLLNKDSISLEEYKEAEGICILSFLLMMIAVRFMRRIKTKRFQFLDQEPRIFAYYILLLLAVAVNLLEIYSAGGIVSYFSASYQAKFSSVAAEKMLGGIGKLVAPFAYYNLLYVTEKPRSTIHWVARIYFVFHLAMSYASGASLAILYQLVAFCCMKIFASDDVEDRKEKIRITRKQRKWIFRGILLGGLGVLIAILVRFNRDAEGFSFAVLKDTYDLLITTSTFDSLYYLSRTLRELTPQYSLGQFLFPFIFWVPRSMFPWKPVELGRIVAITFKNFDSSVNGGYAVTPMAEFYYDMGYVGMIAGSFFLGCLLSLIQKKLNHSKNGRYKMVITMMFMFPTISLATSWSSLGSNYVGAVLFLCVASFLNRCKSGEGTR